MIDKFQKHLGATQHSPEAFIKRGGDGIAYRFIDRNASISFALENCYYILEVKPKLLLKMWKLL